MNIDELFQLKLPKGKILRGCCKQVFPAHFRRENNTWIDRLNRGRASGSRARGWGGGGEKGI